MISRGVTLAESILAVFLLSLIVLLIFNLYPTAMVSLRGSGQNLQANDVADSVMDEYQEKRFTSLVAGPPTVLPKRPGRGTEFTPTVEIFEVNRPNVDKDRIKGIRVTVTWVDHGQTKKLVRETLRTNVLR